MKYALGVDTGLANNGFAVVDLDQQRVVSMSYLETKLAKKRVRATVSDEDFRRSMEIAAHLERLIETWHPRVICYESLSQGFSNAGTSTKIGRAFGVLAAVAQRYDLPALGVSPPEIKVAATGNKKATKEEVMRGLDEAFDTQLGMTHLVGVPLKSHEHPYDALGAVLACKDDPIMRLLRG